MGEASAAMNASADAEMLNAGGADQSAQQQSAVPASGQSGPSGTNASAPTVQNIMGWSNAQLDYMNHSVGVVVSSALERSLPAIVSKVAEAVAAQQTTKSTPADGAGSSGDTGSEV